MGHPRQDKALSRSHQLILKYRSSGKGSQINAQEQSVAESDRRRDDEAVAQAVAGTRAPQSSPQGGVPVAPIPPAPASVDRLHKDAPSYVVVSHDHPVGEDPVANPGYAVKGHASSIVDGMAQAVYHQRTSGGRVVLQIWGGQWNEDLVLNFGGIDVMGVDRPVILGHSLVLPPTMQTRVEGIIFQSPDNTEAMHVHPGPCGLGTISEVQFYDCEFYGAQKAFVSQRPVFLDRCVGVQQTNPELLTLTPAMDFQAAPSDSVRSICRRCAFEGYRSFDGFSGDYDYLSIAVRGTAKVNNPTINGGYLQGTHNEPGLDNQFTMVRSGLVLDDCYVYGSLLNVGWNILQRGGAGHSGFPAPDARRGVYALLQGWDIYNNDGYYGNIPAQTFLDNTNVHSGYIGKFIADPAQATPYVRGGTLWFRNSLHLTGYDTVAGTAVINAGSTGRLHVLNSVTPSTTWPPSGVVAFIANSTNGSDLAALGYPPSTAVQMLLDWYNI